MIGELGKRVLLSRRDLNMGQKELASMVGVSMAYISDIERGKATNVTINVIFGLASALGVSVPYLLGLSDDPLPPGEGGGAFQLAENQVMFEVGSKEEQRAIKRLVEYWQGLNPEARQLVLDLVETLQRGEQARRD